MEMFKENWLTILAALLGLLEIIARLTPTKKDDSIISFLLKIVNFLLPNNKKGGGTH